MKEPEYAQGAARYAKTRDQQNSSDGTGSRLRADKWQESKVLRARRQARTINRRVSWFGFWIGCSWLLCFGVNVAALSFLPLLITTLASWTGGFPRLGVAGVCIVLFGVGAVCSTAQGFLGLDVELFVNSLRVLPNYLYWCLILLVFGSIGRRWALEYDKVFRMIGAGLVTTVVYHLTLQDSLAQEYFLKRFEANNMSFLLICFTPYLIYWLRRRFSLLLAIPTLALILSQQLVAGRRAGFVLILAGGVIACSVHMLKLGSPTRLFQGVTAIVLLVVCMQISEVRNLVGSLSPRIHELMYTGGSTLGQDRSYQTRLAMIEKGRNLFLDNMLFGVGLNNFGKVKTMIDGNFEGGEVMKKKDIFERTSAHNSYVNLLAEGGMAVFVPFVSLVLFLLWKVVRTWADFNDCERLIVASCCAMLIHFYFMSAILNSVSWFNLGLLLYAVTRVQGRRGRKAALMLGIAGKRLRRGESGVTGRIEVQRS